MKNYDNKEKLYRKSKLSKEGFNKLWIETSKDRKSKGTKLELIDKWERTLFFNMTNEMKIKLENIYSNLSKNKDEIKVKEEGFYSANIEGANTTIERYTSITNLEDIARNKDEYMSLNTLISERYIYSNKHNEISHNFIKEIHKIITDKCLDDGSQGEYREGEVKVIDGSNMETLFTAPKYTQIKKMLDSLVNFVSFKEIDPIIKGAIAHFYFVHVHPFLDGNGRTSRALHLKIMIDRDINLYISKQIAENKSKYYKAIRNTEEEGDLTYFIDYILDILY